MNLVEVKLPWGFLLQGHRKAEAEMELKFKLPESQSHPLEHISCNVSVVHILPVMQVLYKQPIDKIFATGWQSGNYNLLDMLLCGQERIPL